jgi:dihydrofolate reductase
MRRLTAFNHVSADGYFATPDGVLNWTIPDSDIDQSALNGMPGGDTILFGRKTYDQFESFWPHALDDPKTAQDPHDAHRRAPALREMAKWINDATKWVFSRTRKEVTWKNSRLLHQFDPHEVQALKKQPGKDMIIFGSGSILSQLTEHGLIDEYTFVVGPIFLAGGRPLIAGLSKNVQLDLLEAKANPSGNVVLRYAPRRG